VIVATRTRSARQLANLHLRLLSLKTTEGGT